MRGGKMSIHFVFTRNDKSFISRAIMWFEQRRVHKDRRCSHGLMKFWPSGPVFRERHLAFEAMERGVWMNLYEKSLGAQTVVADFELDLPDHVSDEVVRIALERYSDWYYDFEGVAMNAIWILMKRWFGTIVRWLKFTWKFEVEQGELFCTGLLYEIAKVAQEHDELGRNWVDDIKNAEESTPRKLIDACFGNTQRCYKWKGGTAKP
jgi:hypothetical protein